MNNSLVKDIAFEMLMQSPAGEGIQKFLDIFGKVQQISYTLLDKDEGLDLTALKAGTVITFAILKKIASGKKIDAFTENDWSEIGSEVMTDAVMLDGMSYSVKIFDYYIKYIRWSANLFDGFTQDKIVEDIRGLADELESKKGALQNGNITEVAYTEDCLWICFEAMIKLLAASFSIRITTDDPDYLLAMQDLGQAVASYAVYYGRYSLYKQEQELLEEYINNQHILDEQLSEKFEAYKEKLETQSKLFDDLMANAFSPDFRDRFINSVKLAHEVGVDTDEILDSIDKIDDFFN